MNKKNKLHPRTIKGEIFVNSIRLALAILIIFSLELATILYYSGTSNAHAVLRQRNYAINYSIDGRFTKVHNIVDFLSSNNKVRNSWRLSEKDRQDVLDLYADLEQVDPDINYIYSGYADGSLLINDYTPPAGYNAVERPWYQAALKARPYVSDGLPYQEIKDKQWLVSISSVLLDKQERVTGVVAVDCAVDKVVSLLWAKIDNFASAYSFIAKADGRIIIHPDESYLGRTVSGMLRHSVVFDHDHGQFDCSPGGVDSFACYSKIDAIGWVVVTVIAKKAVMMPIVWEIAVSSALTCIVAIMLGWFLSASLSRRFVTPLLSLRKRVMAIAAGNEDTDDSCVYPDNEIGLIAADIEQLTERGQYNKNVELRAINKELEVLSSTDQLTKLFNRHKMHSELEREWKRTLRYGQNFSLIMFDIDWFKRINDSYGHNAGDDVLAEISALTRQTLRDTDIVARWGGEEFLVLCPETDLSAAEGLAMKLRERVEEYDFSVPVVVTISCGVCESGGFTTIEELIKQTDANLYSAKQQGRNMVVVS